MGKKAELPLLSRVWRDPRLLHTETLLEVPFRLNVYKPIFCVNEQTKGLGGRTGLFILEFSAMQHLMDP